MTKRNFTFLFVTLIFFFTAPFVLGQSNTFLNNPLGANSTLLTVIGGVATFIAGLVGVLSALVFLWAGILYLTSAGNQSQLEKARKALVYGAIGLAIAISGNAIILTVLDIIS